MSSSQLRNALGSHPKRFSAFWLSGIITSALLWGASAQPSFAQTTPSQSVTASVAVPDERVLSRLVWTTLVALDNANRTENYSVLHDLGSLGFQRKNSPQQLSANFAQLRQNRIDVGRAVLLTPRYYRPPAITEARYLRLRGGFDDRPQSIRFDILYENQNGAWQIAALSVVQMDSSAPKN